MKKSEGSAHHTGIWKDRGKGGRGDCGKLRKIKERIEKFEEDEESRMRRVGEEKGEKEYSGGTI